MLIAFLVLFHTRLRQIASDACQNALGSAEFYEHTKTESWNTTIINSILKSLISESTPPTAVLPPLNTQLIAPSSNILFLPPRSTNLKPYLPLLQLRRRRKMMRK
ncbi:hypothetical protein DID88_001859 [Monilinia fructigena]|uniref:Uncharacterized protein n=1 Tax=Monilinia fructigena TaxID=38457 RepID=A0A395IYA1_9HELO|nr:hypothetical protein DID88_001859 [Monilinia fructigena]